MKPFVQDRAEGEINLLDYWRTIVRWKKTIILIVVAVTFSAAIISLLLDKVYKTQATIMPIGGQKAGGLAAALSQVGGVGGLLAGGGLSSSSLQLMAILTSQTLAERMIEKNDLMKVFYPEKKPSMEDAVSDLLSRVSFIDNKKTQLLEISAQGQDPELAAELVNGYVKELADYIHDNTFTAAKRNRIFIEEQLERNNAEFLKSGKELSTFYAMNKVSNIVPTVDVDVSVKSEESTLAIDELQRKVEEVDDRIRKAKIVEGIPQQVYLQYMTLRRDLLGQVNTLLTQQYEMAKIEETKEDLSFQVIDWARVPVKKFKPKRKQIVMAAFVVALFLGVSYAFFREFLEKSSET